MEVPQNFGEKNSCALFMARKICTWGVLRPCTSQVYIPECNRHKSSFASFCSHFRVPFPRHVSYCSQITIVWPSSRFIVMVMWRINIINCCSRHDSKAIISGLLEDMFSLLSPQAISTSGSALSGGRWNGAISEEPNRQAKYYVRTLFFFWYEWTLYSTQDTFYRTIGQGTNSLLALTWVVCVADINEALQMLLVAEELK